MEYSSRMIAILKILEQKKEPAAAKEIAGMLGLSSKTVRSEIRAYQNTLEADGIRLHVSTHLGYWVDEEDREKLRQTVHMDVPEASLDSQEERVLYVIRKLLLGEKYVKTDILAEELHLSRSSMTRLLNDVRTKLGYYHLAIKSRPFYGITLEGEELDRRLCIARYCVNDGHMEVYSDHVAEMRNQIEIRLYDILQKNQYRLTDIGFRNLTVHLLIAVKRIENGYYIDGRRQLDKERYIKEFRLAGMIASEIGGMYQVTFPQTEIYYILAHLVGKRDMHNEDIVLESDMILLVSDIYREIKNRFQIELSNDSEMAGMLIRHMIPMMERLRLGMKVHNPMMDEIRSIYAVGYSMAQAAADIIREKYDLELPEDEAGYLALHFSFALERKQEKHDHKKILLVCSSGTGTSLLLKRRLLGRFQLREEDIEVCGLMDIGELESEKYACILTTVHLPKEFHIPTFAVSPAEGLSEDKTFFSLMENAGSGEMYEKLFPPMLFLEEESVKGREEVITCMVEQLKNYTKLPAGFLDSVIERERLGSTEVGNGIALPHTCRPVLEQPIVCVMTVKKPFLWERQKVRMIIMACMSVNDSKENEHLGDCIARLAVCGEKIEKILQNPDYRTFLQMIKELW